MVPGRDKQFITKVPQAERVAWMWCLIFAFWVPEFGAWFRSMRICFFKSWKKPPLGQFLIVFTAETCHTVGIALLVFSVLPDLDVVKGAMLTNCLCFFPGVMGLLSRNSKDSKKFTFIKVVVDLCAIAAQATGFVVWPIVENKRELWLTPVAIFLVSVGWWENYVCANSAIPFMKALGKMKKDLDSTRYFMYMFLSIWKMVCFFCAALVIIWFKEGSIGFFFTEFSTGFGPHAITVQEVSTDEQKL